MTRAILLMGALVMAMTANVSADKPGDEPGDDPAALAGWELVFADEFDEPGLPNPDHWVFEEGFVRNFEEQYYTVERRENVRVEGGRLIIEGRREAFDNPEFDPAGTNWRQQRETARYTSGSINTLGKHAFRYGRVEVRAKVPRGKGAWPAIWMMGVDRDDVGWPRCGEIDIMEYVGKQPHTIHAATHFADPSIDDRDVHVHGGSGKIKIAEPWNDFHVYAIEWDADEIRFFADGERYHRFEIDRAGEGPDNPYRRPHFLLLNLAIGGTWGGEVDDDAMPMRYEIDYVRVYRAAE